MTWTRFLDMSSGGKEKLEWHTIYIEADKEKAKEVFKKLFGRDPENETCSCCGQDYSINSGEVVEQVTGYDRGCHYDEQARKYVEIPTTRYRTVEKVLTVSELAKKPGFRFIPKGDFE